MTANAASCSHCEDEPEHGWIETDNNGPIVPCPVCNPHSSATSSRQPDSSAATSSPLSGSQFTDALRPSINNEPSLWAGPQAEASHAGTGSRTLVDREGRIEGEAASADLPTHRADGGTSITMTHQDIRA